MRLLFTIVICALSLNAIAQSNNPYFNPDYNWDSFIGVDDILGVLSAYNNDWIHNAEAIDSGVMSWTCGDPWNHQGYWYSTIEIGEQCWFKENLRATSFTNNPYATEFLDSSNVAEVWANATSPLWGYSFDFWQSPYWNHDPSNSLHADINDERGKAKGLLYNWYAVNSVENLCPTGWHVSNYLDWAELVETVSQTLEDISIWGVESGYSWEVYGMVGDELKSGNFNGGFEIDYYIQHQQNPDWGLSGFSAQASTYRSSPIESPASSPGFFNWQDETAQWWIADTVITPNNGLYGSGTYWLQPENQSGNEVGIRVRLQKGSGEFNSDVLFVNAAEKYSGYSVRCVKGCDIHPQCCDCWCSDFDVDEDGICDSVDDCIPDAIGVCGGECEWDEDGDGICDEEED